VVESMAKLIGSNAGGNLGWVIKYCKICNKKLVVGVNAIYVCPKCTPTLNTYYCLAEYKRLHGKCPYCRSDLTPI
jgi:hypothetical protein